MRIRLKRIYDSAEADDGQRVLVDRLWPRGVAKVDARIDAWHRTLAPSNELRRWFGHDPERWPPFRGAYEHELADADPDLLAELRQHARNEGLTLLYAARDLERNNAVVLKHVLEQTS